MRYDELLAIYPNLQELFEGMYQLLNNPEASDEMAVRWATDWIHQHIGKDYQVSVARKAHQFFAAIVGKEADNCGTQMKFTEKQTTS